MLEIFIQSFVLYFVVVDPIGSTPIFFVITKNLNIKDKIKTAVNSTIIALLVLIFFALLGNYILNHLNISFSALKIAGGIILFIVSLEMLFSKRQQRKKENTNFHSDNISVFPLAIPLLAGPAAIISVVVSVNNIGSNFINQIVGMTSLVLVMVITFIAFFIVSKFEKVVNEKVINIFSSVIAIILAGLSVQYILDGIKEFII
jgi:multiple antibiotic resistance protein|tara:strand:+ start:1522 stop:2130 length:609 start_codon:yes stop_codon:yes gene_type:complete